MSSLLLCVLFNFCEEVEQRERSCRREDAQPTSFAKLCRNANCVLNTSTSDENQQEVRLIGPHWYLTAPKASRPGTEIFIMNAFHHRLLLSNLVTRFILLGLLRRPEDILEISVIA